MPNVGNPIRPPSAVGPDRSGGTILSSIQSGPARYVVTSCLVLVFTLWGLLHAGSLAAAGEPACDAIWNNLPSALPETGEAPNIKWALLIEGQKDLPVMTVPRGTFINKDRTIVVPEETSAIVLAGSNDGK